MLEVFPIPAFSDNYIWCVHQQNHAVIIDPGDADVVETHLQAQQLQLSAILITHHHWDHTNGLDALLSSRQIPVYGPANTVPQVNQPMADGDHIHIAALNWQLQVMAVPGHTLDHLAYYDQDRLFCGDTLFSAGCGRLFEGSPQQLHQSLTQLTQLDGTTQVYCTHEYTSANLQFARAVADSPALSNRQKQVNQLRTNGLPSLPTTLTLERQTNPFLRCDDAAVREAAEHYNGHPLNTPSDVFAALRSWKDEFAA